LEPRTRQVLWFLLVAAYWVLQLVYFISPVDLIPDVALGVGQLDDLGGMLSALVLTGVAVATKRFSGKPKALPNPK
jgi:uncharacterized membrane protein YkvA (DUF1232 family)